MTALTRDDALRMGGMARARTRHTGHHGAPRKVDKNQAQIVAELRQAGSTVTDLHTVGAGCPDLLCSHPLSRPQGQNYLFEVKGDGGKLTDDEIEWHAEWPGQKAIIHDSLEALRIMGVIR